MSVPGDNGGFVRGEARPIRPRSHKDETTSELSECAHTIPNNGSGQWGNLLLFNSVNLLFPPKDPVTQFPPALLNFVILNPCLTSFSDNQSKCDRCSGVLFILAASWGV